MCVCTYSRGAQQREHLHPWPDLREEGPQAGHGQRGAWPAQDLHGCRHSCQAGAHAFIFLMPIPERTGERRAQIFIVLLVVREGLCT